MTGTVRPESHEFISSKIDRARGKMTCAIVNSLRMTFRSHCIAGTRNTKYLRS